MNAIHTRQSLFAGLTLLLTLFAGCDGQLRVDGSTESSTQASAQAISESLGPKEAAEFKAAMREITARNQSEHLRAPDEERQRFLKEKVHGKTATQIIEAGNASRRKRLKTFGSP